MTHARKLCGAYILTDKITPDAIIDYLAAMIPSIGAMSELDVISTSICRLSDHVWDLTPESLLKTVDNNDILTEDDNAFVRSALPPELRDGTDDDHDRVREEFVTVSTQILAEEGVANLISLNNEIYDAADNEFWGVENISLIVIHEDTLHLGGVFAIIRAAREMQELYGLPSVRTVVHSGTRLSIRILSEDPVEARKI